LLLNSLKKKKYNVHEQLNLSWDVVLARTFIRKQGVIALFIVKKAGILEITKFQNRNVVIDLTLPFEKRR